MTELTLDEAAQLAPAVSPQEAAARVAAGAVLIDVRSPAGRANGTVDGALPVSKDSVPDQLGLDSPTRLAQVSGPDTPIVVVCGSVLGSGPVAAYLRSQGYRDVVQVDGGFPAWQAAGLPTGPGITPA